MMPTDDTDRNDNEPRSLDDVEIRKTAIKRSWICAGAGFALLGKSGFAIATFVASLCVVPAIAWVAFRPTAASFVTTVAVGVIATILWLAEQIAVKKARIQTPSPAILTRGFIASSCIMWLGIVVAIGLLVTAFGSLRMVSSGMAPTLEKSERLVYHKHLDRRLVRPGGIIVYKNANDSAWGEPGWIVISRILAGPGDVISMQDGQYVVNGVVGPPVAGTGNYDAVVDVPYSPNSLTIPDGCYFVVQDSPMIGFDSRVLSWIRDDTIITTRLWYLSRRGICKPVK